MPKAASTSATAPLLALPGGDGISQAEIQSFLLLDDGSGINPAKTLLTESGDTLTTAHKARKSPSETSAPRNANLFLTFRTTRETPPPRVHWKIKADGDSVRVTGPFDDGGDK